MTKTKRMLITQMGLVDIVAVLLDARVPLSSQNPDLYSLAKDKKRILVLNKADLADSNVTALWESFFKTKGFFVVPVNSTNTSKEKSGLHKFNRACAEVMDEKIRRQKSRGRSNARIKVMVVGIPNVGKSTFINQLVGKSGAKAADRPGVTRGRQWLKAEGFDLLDTPGILWPKFEDRLVGLNLAATGAISDNVFDKTLLAEYLIEKLRDINPSCIPRRYYGGEERECSLLEIGKARGFKLKGDRVDLLRSATILLDEFRGGKLGRISLEKPL